jgi:ribonucleoside-triphosphate reductase (formate)
LPELLELMTVNYRPFVLTQDGYIEIFDRGKIIKAITKDIEFLKAQNPEAELIGPDEVKRIAEEVERNIFKMDFRNNDVISSDTIRGLVVGELYKIEKIDLLNIAEIVGPRLTDVLKIWNISDDEAHESAILDASNQETMHKRLADIIAEKAMWRLLPESIVKSHLSGELWIHDREYFFTRSFCLDSDLRYIFYYGLYPDGRGISFPVARAARRAEVAFLHAAKALASAQCNCAGGQGYQSFNIFIAPYLESKSYDVIKQLAQMFVFEMGQMTAARGAQAVFSSIQLFPGVPEIWKDKPAIYKGQISDRKYGEFDRETRLLFKAFMEVFYEGDARGRPFSFPKPEIVITREFLDEKVFDEHCRSQFGAIPSYKDLYRLAFKLALKNGAPYFDNQYGNTDPLNSISCVQCCAYGFQADAKSDAEFRDRLNFRDGAHFDCLGSMQVISLNLPRAAYISGGNFYRSLDYLKDLIDKCIEIFKIKKNSIKRQPSPFIKQMPIDPNDENKHAPPYCNHDKLSYIIGIVGLNEYTQAMIGKQLHEGDEAVILGNSLLAGLNLHVGKVAHENDMIISLARTPAESTAQRFAVADLMRYPEHARHYVKGNLSKALELIDETRDLPIEYSNGTHCSVNAPIPISKKAKIEGEFFKILKGGNIFHIWLGDLNPFYSLDSVVDENLNRIPLYESPQNEMIVDALMDFGLDLARNTPITYFAFSRDITICNKCNSIAYGLSDQCGYCGSIHVDHFARITGYMSAVSGWNEAKKQELLDRHRILSLG